MKLFLSLAFCTSMAVAGESGHKKLFPFWSRNNAKQDKSDLNSLATEERVISDMDFRKSICSSETQRALLRAYIGSLYYFNEDVSQEPRSYDSQEDLYYLKMNGVTMINYLKKKLKTFYLSQPPSANEDFLIDLSKNPHSIWIRLQDPSSQKISNYFKITFSSNFDKNEPNKKARYQISVFEDSISRDRHTVLRSKSSTEIKCPPNSSQVALKDWSEYNLQFSADAKDQKIGENKVNQIHSDLFEKN